MLKQYADILYHLSIVGDICLIVISFLGAYKICGFYNEPFIHNDYFIKHYFLVFITFILLSEWSLYVMGIYRSFRLKKLREIVWIIVKSMLLTFFSLAAVLYLFKIENISRLLVISLFLGATALLLTEKC